MRFVPRRKSPPTAPPRRRKRVADAAPAPARAAAAEVRDRRQVSGVRVLCRCSLELPKLDPFSAYRARRDGFMILNVRGGSLYLAEPFTEVEARRAFPSDKALDVKRFTLHPETGEPIELGRVGVRYLKTVRGDRLDGLVLRFVGLDERQIDLLNALRDRCPAVEGREEDAVPEQALRAL